MDTKTPPETESLKRVFNLATLTIYGVGDILGAGIYATIGKVAGFSGSLIWASFLVAALVAAFTALSYAALGSRFPRSGGVAYFVNEAFHNEWLSTMVGWLMFCTCLVSMANLSIAFADYFNVFIPVIPPWSIVLALFSVLAYINFRGMEESSLLNIICTSIEVSGLLIVVFVATAFLFGGGTVSNPEAVGSIVENKTITTTAIFNGAALAFYSFIGFEDLVNVSEEVKNPERNVPRAIILALTIAGAIYMVISWLSINVVDPETLSKSTTPLLEVVTRSQPKFPRVIFSLIALFAVLNTTLLNFITASRLLFGMAREGLLPSWLGKLHRSRSTPYRTLLVILPIAICLALSGSIKLLAGATAVLILLMFCCVNLSLLAIERREKTTHGFKVPLFVPALAIIFNIALVFYAESNSRNLAIAFIGVGLILLLIRKIWQK